METAPAAAATRPRVSTVVGPLRVTMATPARASSDHSTWLRWGLPHPSRTHIPMITSGWIEPTTAAKPPGRR